MIQIRLMTNMGVKLLFIISVFVFHFVTDICRVSNDFYIDDKVSDHKELIISYQMKVSPYIERLITAKWITKHTKSILKR